MKHSADVIIVGGGIIGCAAAYYLAKEVFPSWYWKEAVILETGFLQKRRRCPPVRT